MFETSQSLNLTPAWQTQPWSATVLLMLLNNVGVIYKSVTQTQNIVMQLIGPHSSFSIKQPTAIRGFEGLTKTLESNGISGVVQHLSLIPKGSISNY